MIKFVVTIRFAMELQAQLKGCVLLLRPLDGLSELK